MLLWQEQLISSIHKILMYFLRKVIFTGLIFLSWELNAQVALPTFQSVQLPPYVPGSQTFSYTESEQTWTVPSGVTSITVDVKGAQGGNQTGPSASGGKGGRAQATISVTAGATIYVYVGGAGTTVNSSTSGGFNGGGGTNCSGSQIPGTGGGASDIRIGGNAYSNRVIVAGGGGGGGGYSSSGSDGGTGGGTTGGDAEQLGGANYNGKGGTQSAGGAYGQTNSGTTPGSGSLGTGGRGQGFGNGGGGGGGGYYGGGGGWGFGGGGGSGYVGYSGNSSTSMTSDYNSGNGEIIITW